MNLIRISKDHVVNLDQVTNVELYCANYNGQQHDPPVVWIGYVDGQYQIFENANAERLRAYFDEILPWPVVN